PTTCSATRRRRPSTTKCAAWSRPACGRAWAAPVAAGSVGNGTEFRFDFGDGNGGGVFSDLLGGLFGNRGGGGAGGAGGGGRGRRPAGPQRGQDLETELHLSFADAVHGVTSTVRFRADAVCDTCHGNGA